MRTIWITGGSSGIGYAVAEKFLKKEWRVIISSRNEERLNKSVKKLKKRSNNNEVYSIVCNITDYSNVKKTIKGNKLQKIYDIFKKWNNERLSYPVYEEVLLKYGFE